MARARRDFFPAMEVYTNQAWMASLGVVANRAFLFYQSESLTFEEPNQFAEFHLVATIARQRKSVQVVRRINIWLAEGQNLGA